MSGYLELNTTQKVRECLASLGVDAPAVASSDDVIGFLVGRIRLGGGDPAVRARLLVLVDEFCREGTTPRLAAPGCETEDARALAAELAVLVNGRAVLLEGGRARVPVAIVAVAGLLLGGALAMGCTTTQTDELQICLDEVSSDHFDEMVDAADDVDGSLEEQVAFQFANLSDEGQEEAIDDLCRMTPDEIADYLVNGFQDICDGEDPADDDAAYKGVLL